MADWQNLFRLLIIPGMLACAGGTRAEVKEEPSEWLYRAWQVDNGLPDNSVTGVAQSPDGYLWVATRGGLLRFNGTEFKEMPTTNLSGVPNRVVRSMLIDHLGRLWLATARGPVICLEKEKAVLFGTADGIPDTQAGRMVEDGEGAVWVSFSNGISRFKDGACTSFGVAEGIPRGGGTTSIATDAKGALWFSRGSQLGVFRNGKLLDRLELDGSPVRMCAAASSGLWICAGNRLLRYEEGGPPEERAVLPDKIEPRVMLEDQSGALWIGTAANGLFRFYNGLLSSVSTSHQEIDCLSEDREGNLWVGTSGGGLDQIRPRALTMIGRAAGLPTESVRTICGDGSGGYWAALQNGMLAVMRNGRWKEVGDADGWTKGDATCVAGDHHDGVWVGTREQGLRHFSNGVWRTWDQAAGLASDSIRSLLVSREGDVWIATDSPRRLQRLRDGKLTTMQLEGEIRSIRAMAEGKDGTIWIGTAEGQLLKVSGDLLVKDPCFTEEVPISIRCLHATPDGSLWIGYAGYGVGRLNGKSYARITKASGLMDDYASQILSDDRGSLWIVGNHGLLQVSLSEMVAVAEGRAGRLRSRVFGRNEGIVNLSPSFDYFPSICQSQDGRLWFAMRNGLLVVRPDEIRDNPTPPPVVVERISVDDRTVALYDALSPIAGQGGGTVEDLHSERSTVLQLSPGLRKLAFDFAGLSFVSPEDNHFRYRLSNFDREWIVAGTSRSAVYPQLPAGKYEFQVNASNNAGVWNPTGATIRFVVAPFFWQTWWFRGLALALFTAGVILIVRYVSFRRLRERMRGLKQQAALHQERERIARDMHDEVGAKLTRLSLLSEMARGHSAMSDSASADVAEISETARETILAFDEIVWAVNPRNDTLADLTNYLCRHAEDYFEGSPTQSVFSLPQIIPPVMVPTEVRHQIFLAAKEALNNVLKHSKATQVDLQLILHPGAFELIIHDNGVGFEPGVPSKRAGGGNGLSNMQERIRGVEGSFECVIQPGQGTRISFKVPLS